MKPRILSEAKALLWQATAKSREVLRVAQDDVLIVVLSIDCSPEVVLSS
ncbi:hypothetical protein [Legionella maceachernii]|nr:hypothetical protein [Legionella maceachernii]